MKARTHPTCLGSLERIFTGGHGRVTPLGVLVFVFLDQSITIELRLLLDVLNKRPRFSLLEEA